MEACTTLLWAETGSRRTHLMTFWDYFCVLQKRVTPPYWVPSKMNFLGSILSMLADNFFDVPQLLHWEKQWMTILCSSSLRHSVLHTSVKIQFYLERLKTPVSSTKWKLSIYLITFCGAEIWEYRALYFSRWGGRKSQILEDKVWHVKKKEVAPF